MRYPTMLGKREQVLVYNVLGLRPKEMFGELLIETIYEYRLWRSGEPTSVKETPKTGFEM